MKKFLRIIFDLSLAATLALILAFSITLFSGGKPNVKNLSIANIPSELFSTVSGLFRSPDLETSDLTIKTPDKTQTAQILGEETVSKNANSGSTTNSNSNSSAASIINYITEQPTKIGYHQIEAENMDGNSITSRTIKNQTIRSHDLARILSIQHLTIDHDLTATAIHGVVNAEIQTIDLGTNTISDGTLTGNWDFGSGSLTTTGTLTVGAVGTSGDLDMNAHIIKNIGNAGTDFDALGGLTLANGLTVTTGGITATGNSQITGNLTTTTINTGQGNYELYAMDQNVLTSSSPTFAGLTLNGNLALGSNTLTTSNTALISNLNADLLDGLHASQIATLPGGSNTYVQFNNSGAFGGDSGFTYGSGIATLSTALRVPKIYPTVDSTTAFQINKADGTTNVLNVDTTNGRVGMGITPTVGLDIYNNDAANASGQTVVKVRAQLMAVTPGSGGRIVFTDPGGTNAAGIRSYVFGPGNVGLALETGWNAIAPKLLINNDGLVGFGTTSPASLLDVNGTAWLRGTGTSGLFVNSSGNVGIGTTGPGYKLEVNGSVKFSGGQSFLITGEAAFDTGLKISGGDLYSYNGYRRIRMNQTNVDFEQYLGNDFRFRSNAGNNWADTDLVIIKGNGNVGIGTTNPVSKIDVNGTAWLRGASGGTSGLYVNSSGNVGIGTTSPSYLVDINGSGRIVTSLTTSTVNAVAPDSGSGSVLIGNWNGAHGGRLYYDGSGGLVLKGRLSSVEGSELMYVTLWGANAGNISMGYANPGTAKLAINGNVGIGTTNPVSLLDVNGTAWLRGSAGGTSGLYVNSSGNVGIGTTGPSQLLHVFSSGTSVYPIYGQLTSGDVGERSAVYGNSGTNNAQGYLGGYKNSINSWFGVYGTIQNSGSAIYGAVIGGGNGYAGYFSGKVSMTNTLTLSNNLQFQGNLDGYSNAFIDNVFNASGYNNNYGSIRFRTTNGTLQDRLYIGGGGNVGIGTINPAYKLDLNGSLGVGGTAYFTSNVGIGTTNPSKKLQIHSATADTQLYLSSVAPSMVLGNNDIAGSGTNFAVLGLATSTSHFITESAAGDMAIRTVGANGGTAGNILFGIGTSEKVRITNGGNIGIGTTGPSTKLHVVSTSDGNTATIADSDGTCVLDPESGGSWSCTSDERLKKDVTPLLSPLDLIMALNPVSFRMKSSGDLNYGFIAQEVQKIYPNAVSTLPGGYLGVAEGKLMPYVVGAIKEQQKEITTQGTILSGLSDKSLSLDEKFNLIGAEIDLNTSNIGKLESQLEDLKMSHKRSEASLKALVDQLTLIEETNQAVIDFAKVFDPKTLVYKDSMGNLNLADGKITARDIEVLGEFKAQNVEATYTVQGETIKGNAFEAGSDTSGKAIITAGKTEVVIETPEATIEAKIYITPTVKLDSRSLYVDERSLVSGESFKVKLNGGPSDEGITFNWLIIK